MCLVPESDIKKDMGVYVGVEDDEEDEDDESETKDDGLGDIWQEMSMALECSKVFYSVSLFMNFYASVSCLYHVFLQLYYVYDMFLIEYRMYETFSLILILRTCYSCKN